MSSDEVSRMFMPQRKTVARSNSSSSLSSNSSTSSTATVTPLTSSDTSAEPASTTKKKARGGFWPVSKSESTSSLSNARANGSLQTAIGNSMIGKNPVQPALPSQNANGQTNGARALNGQASSETLAMLALLPMNGTFERKQINLPFYPEVLRVGRQTNAKTVPTPVNGYFDSKVLSRQHAEVWAERNGKVWIRDVKSSNGTFVNGQRLSPENRDSEPHELRQHDTLELGIDIVSEDQKTIVHHKVSAKVEYVGLPSSSNNVLDLSFGDLDPSHGASLLPSPVSTPMMHSRSRSGGPITNGRASVTSSVAGGPLSSAAQQRQMNFYGSPMNIEHLVKTVAVSDTFFSFGQTSTDKYQTEMRVAKQQAEELDQAGSFLHAVLNANGDASKIQSLTKESVNHAQRQSNGRSKSVKLDHVNRFADPPAPPPQQPLPEKPDVSRASPASSSSFTNLLKRSETAKTSNTSHSPTNTQSSQMLSLIEALSIAKKELDSQGARVKQLEDKLMEERSARESAEERVRTLEQHAAARPVSHVDEEQQAPTTESVEQTPEIKPGSVQDGQELSSKEQQLKESLDAVVAEMQTLKMDMDHFQRRAEVAENDASQARASLAEMITKIREENKKSATETSEPIEREPSTELDRAVRATTAEEAEVDMKTLTKWPSHTNGQVRAPKLPKHLEHAITTVLKERNVHGDPLTQSAPYVSMLGVVLIGVGLMAYLNSWQKAEK